MQAQRVSSKSPVGDAATGNSDSKPTRTSSMTVGELQHTVSRVSYKPGWTFEVYAGEWEGPHIKIVAKGLPNSYQSGKVLDIGVHSMIPPMETERQFVRWLAWRLGRIENHEMREFLKIDGRIVFDPHAPLASEDRD